MISLLSLLWPSAGPKTIHAIADLVIALLVAAAIFGAWVYVDHREQKIYENGFAAGSQAVEAKWKTADDSRISQINDKLDVIRDSSTQNADSAKQLVQQQQAFGATVLATVKGKVLIDSKTCLLTDDFAAAWEKLRHAPAR